MDLESLDPALRDVSRHRRLDIDVGRPSGRRLVRAGYRLMPVRSVPGVRRRHVRQHGVDLRLHVPDVRRTDGALLWLHGGGLLVGSARADGAACGETARRLGVVVVAPDYRLAPEHPFPAALDDCHAAWRWLRGHAAELGVDPARLAVGGASAGGGLAAALAQRLHDEGDDPVAQWLFCPMLDDRTALRGELDQVDHLVWNNASNRAGWAGYLGHPVGAGPVPPYAVPARRDDLTGLAPAWLSMSDVELFADEIAAYAARLDAVGVDTTLDVVPGAPHGFEAWAPQTEPARRLLARAHDWLGAALADG